MPSYVVVGASRGLGYEWLRQLSKDPQNTVVGLARTPATVESRLAKDSISNVHILAGDMVDHNSLTAAANAASSILPDNALDTLIVNGAYMNPETTMVLPSSFTSKPEQLHKDMHASLDVNVLGVVYSINAFLPLIQRGAIKKIIVISTGLADPDLPVIAENPMSLTYSSMKAALNMVVAKFAAELKSQGVTVLALSPGLVATKETPPTEQELKEFQIMIENFKKTAPHWNGPLSPAESVELQTKVINKVTVEDTGKFLSHWGDKNWL